LLAYVVAFGRPCGIITSASHGSTQATLHRSRSRRRGDADCGLAVALRADRGVSSHSDEIAENDKRSTVLGDSLLGVLHQWMTSYYEMELGAYEHPSNRRRGSDSYVVNATRWLNDLEKLQRKLAEQLAARL
jgi:hypothetical protein